MAFLQPIYAPTLQRKKTKVYVHDVLTKIDTCEPTIGMYRTSEGGKKRATISYRGKSLANEASVVDIWIVLQISIVGTAATVSNRLVYIRVER